MQPIPKIKAGIYMNKKNEKFYEVLYIAFDKNNDTDIQVVYKDSNNIYVREIHDFNKKFLSVEV